MSLGYYVNYSLIFCNQVNQWLDVCHCSCLLYATCIMYEHNVHWHLLGMKTQPCLSVTDLSPRAISETQTVFMSCQKSQLSKTGRKWDWRSWYLKVNFEAFSCDTYLYACSSVHLRPVGSGWRRRHTRWPVLAGSWCWRQGGWQPDEWTTQLLSEGGWTEDRDQTQYRTFFKTVFVVLIYAIICRHTVAFLFLCYQY